MLTLLNNKVHSISLLRHNQDPKPPDTPPLPEPPKPPDTPLLPEPPKPPDTPPSP